MKVKIHVSNHSAKKKIVQFKVSILGNYRVVQYPGGFREWSNRPGFSSFLVTFFFSFQKEKKEVTKRFEIKEELELIKN
jgi:hypothetical protein